MNEKKDSEDAKPEPGRPLKDGETPPPEAEATPVAGAEDGGAESEARKQAAEEQAEAAERADAEAPEGPDYAPGRDEPEDAGPVGDTPERSAPLEDAEVLDEREQERLREDELAAGLEERGSDAAPEAQREPEAHPHEEEPYAYAHEEEHEEHHRRSLAGRALQALVLLLIGAGLALWGAPKIAPYVPEPVARYLAAPDTVQQDDLAALRAEMQEMRGELADRIESRAQALSEEIPPAADVEGALAPVRERLDQLASQVDEAAGAGPARVSALENEVADLRAQLESLQGSLAGLEGGGGADGPDMARVNAVLDSLRAEIASVSQRTEELASRLDQAEARFEQASEAARQEAEAAQQETQAAQAAAQEAERRATLAAGFRELSSALEEGRPFADALRTMEAEAPEALTAAAEAGVPTLASLRDRFVEAGREALQAQAAAEAEPDFVNQAYAALRARLRGVPVEAQPGEGLEPALGRAAEALREGDLAAALAELEGIPDAAAEAMAPWLQAARARLAAVQAAQSWRTELLGDA